MGKTFLTLSTEELDKGKGFVMFATEKGRVKKTPTCLVILDALLYFFCFVLFYQHLSRTGDDDGKTQQEKQEKEE